MIFILYILLTHDSTKRFFILYLYPYSFIPHFVFVVMITNLLCKAHIHFLFILLGNYYLFEYSYLLTTLLLVVCLGFMDLSWVHPWIECIHKCLLIHYLHYFFSVTIKMSFSLLVKLFTLCKSYDINVIPSIINARLRSTSRAKQVCGRKLL